MTRQQRMSRAEAIATYRGWIKRTAADAPPLPDDFVALWRRLPTEPRRAA